VAVGDGGDAGAVGVLYTPPHTPVGLHLESTWNTTKSVYFWIIELESMWSLHRVHLESMQTPDGLHPNPTELKPRGI